MELDHDTHILVIDGVQVQLTRKEAKLVQYLRDHGGAPVSRETLKREVFGDENSYSNLVDVHVRNIRWKFGQAGVSCPISTVRGVGYAVGI